MGRPAKDNRAALSKNAESFAHAVRVALKAHGRSLRVVASQVNSSATVMSRWQCGSDLPSESQLVVLCNVLNIHGAERERLERLRRAADEDRIASRRDDASTAQGPPRRRVPRLAWVIAAAVATVCVVVLVGVFVLPSGESATPEAEAVLPEAADASVTPVAGSPIYLQCSDRNRSMLSAPGKARGGEHLGYIRPGQEFVVTGETRWWKQGYVKDDPAKRAVFVMSSYLSVTRSRC